MGLPAVRLSDADRNAAAWRLRAAWLEGRLTLPELEQRLDRALRCRLSTELDELLGDLPLGAMPPAPAEPLLPPLAGWGRRSVALLLDHVLLGLAGLVAYAAGGGFAVAALVPLVAVAYFTAAHGGRSGRSIGERICGIAVRSDPHRAHALRRATYGQAFGRALMLYVFAGLSVWGVGAINFLWPLWDVKRQAWHDKVAGTIVVRADALALDRRRWTHRLYAFVDRVVRGPRQ